MLLLKNVETILCTRQELRPIVSSGNSPVASGIYLTRNPRNTDGIEKYIDNRKFYKTFLDKVISFNRSDEQLYQNNTILNRHLDTEENSTSHREELTEKFRGRNTNLDTQDMSTDDSINKSIIAEVYNSSTKKLLEFIPYSAGDSFNMHFNGSVKVENFKKCPFRINNYNIQIKSLMESFLYQICKLNMRYMYGRTEDNSSKNDQLNGTVKTETSKWNKLLRTNPKSEILKQILLLHDYNTPSNDSHLHTEFPSTVKNNHSESPDSKGRSEMFTESFINAERKYDLLTKILNNMSWEEMRAHQKEIIPTVLNGMKKENTNSDFLYLKSKYPEENIQTVTSDPIHIFSPFHYIIFEKLHQQLPKIDSSIKSSNTQSARQPR